MQVYTVSYTSSSYKNFAFGCYADEVLEFVAERFAPAYRHVFAYCWNNCFEARMRRSYARAYWEDCLYEFYVPVAAHPTMNMQYYRIAVKVVPEISQEKAKELTVDLMRPRQRPNGIINSETIFIVAPKRRGWTRGFRHVKLPGHLTCIIVNRNPLEAIKTICKLIWNFIERRILRLLGKFGIQPDCPANEIWYKKDGSFYYCNNYNNRRTRFKLSYHIRQTIRCLSRFLDWLKRKAKKCEAAEKLLAQLRRVGGLAAKREMLNWLWRRSVKEYNDRETVKAVKLLTAFRKMSGG